ncbi:MAG: 16S rRNA (cytosine(1402)-N(4))-methyltransferase RsmH [Ahrensia sp.]
MTGQQPHIPVMLSEVMASIDGFAGKTIVDGTFGAGGYSRAMLDAGASIVGFDRDPHAIAAAAPMIETYGDRLSLVQQPFSTMGDVLAPRSVDAVVLDIGVSSMQLDQAMRGFSFQQDGPLDMRMAQTGPSAADVIKHTALADLIRIIGILGEEKQASRIAKAIDDARKTSSIETTGELVRIIEKANPRKHSDTIHPATRTFQGLRIFVNDELRELGRALFAAETILKPGGMLVVVSFHSLEDRMVKRFLAARSGKNGGSRHLPQVSPNVATFIQDGPAVLSASQEEALINPRARSAKLRAARRSEADAEKPDFGLFKLARLPWIEPVIEETRS